MSTVIAFIGGAFLSGVALAIVFGALHLEVEEKAYRRGYEDGKRCNHGDVGIFCNNGSFVYCGNCGSGKRLEGMQ